MNTTRQRQVTFPLGRLMTTPGALELFSQDEMLDALQRHARGDWGDVSEEDREENETALQHGFRLVSTYHTKTGHKFWIITEADRSATTVLLPSEY